VSDANCINLLNLGSGVLVEKFEEELERVVENILDPNTDPKTKREVILRVSIKPAGDRTFGVVSIAASSRLAASTSWETRAFFGKDRKSGKALAFEDDPRQLTIESFTAPKNVEELPAKEKEKGASK
jgi:hypothetical protein